MKSISEVTQFTMKIVQKQTKNDFSKQFYQE